MSIFARLHMAKKAKNNLISTNISRYNNYTMAKKILIVDDQPDILTLLKDKFKFEGYEVLTATDGQEALKKAQEEGPDIVLLDLMLPKIDGFKVCGLLKADTRYQKIPVIMFSARAQESDKELAKEVGADLYLEKTADINQVSAAVKSILS